MAALVSRKVGKGKTARQESPGAQPVSQHFDRVLSAGHVRV
jgi:hypothetical protein